MCHECRHIMPNGSKCRAPALRGQPYCYFHTRLHTYAAAPARAPDSPLKLPVIEDRSAIQIALAQVFDALGSSQLDVRRAGLFLYGLQIASQNVERRQDIVPITAVHSITQTDAGDVLGPQTTTCPYPFKCDTCDVAEGCPDFEEEEDDEVEEENEEEEEG
jgi:hypothetical protein